MTPALVTGDLDRLAPAWAALWGRVPGATPFQHPDWLLAWWRQFGQQARVAIVQDGEALLGILPLYDLAAEAKTLWIGAGLTDHQDVLVDPCAPSHTAGLLLETALRGAAHACHLTDLPPASKLRMARIEGWRACLHPGEPCPVLAPVAVPPGQRRKLRMARHRADRAGWSYRADDPDGLTPLLALHAARWQERGEAGVLADPRVVAFLSDAMPRLRRAGLATLPTVTLAGQVAAAAIVLRTTGRAYFYIGGFDPARAFESPGTLLIGAVLDEPLEQAHFLRGGEAYKYAWGAIDTHHATMVLTR